jgi:hypothetical protein
LVWIKWLACFLNYSKLHPKLKWLAYRCFAKYFILYQDLLIMLNISDYFILIDEIFCKNRSIQDIGMGTTSNSTMRNGTIARPTNPFSTGNFKLSKYYIRLTVKF